VSVTPRRQFQYCKQAACQNSSWRLRISIYRPIQNDVSSSIVGMSSHRLRMLPLNVRDDNRSICTVVPSRRFPAVAEVATTSFFDVLTADVIAFN